MDRYRCAAAVAIASFVATTMLFAENDEEKGYTSISPDKQWEYRIIKERTNDAVGVLVKAGSDQPVLKFGPPDYALMDLDTGKLLWAPDSRRFAFNCRKGSKYYGSDLYELAGATWKKLPSLQDDESLQQNAEQSLTKRAKQLRLDPKGMIDGMEIWRVRRWIDQDTLEGYAYVERRAKPRKTAENFDSFTWGVIFKARCDNRGDWRVVAVREASDAEIEEEGP